LLKDITVHLGNVYIYVLTKIPGFMALGAKHFLETRLSSKFLEPMISFLAYLEPKLWLTNQNLDINSNLAKGNHGHFG